MRLRLLREGVSVLWENVGGKPSTFPPDPHNHDAAYVNEADHTKAAHDVLGIDAGTLDGVDSTGFARTNDARIPTQGENDALQGTAGAPSGTNRYVTNDDGRNANSRTPTAHKASHASGAADALTPADIGAAPSSHVGSGGRRTPRPPRTGHRVSCRAPTRASSTV